MYVKPVAALLPSSDKLTGVPPQTAAGVASAEPAVGGSVHGEASAVKVIWPAKPLGVLMDAEATVPEYP